ncbi:T9SS type A sorting domain-containing protein [Hymenobacter algoricola]|uniref:T9SS type A sorting domain-containing protein n=1 Tax=Hymenobacter algoricola TaxID=486267 RepID=UPI0031F19ED3
MDYIGQDACGNTIEATISITVYDNTARPAPLSSGFTVYPNPTTERSTVTIASSGAAFEAVLYDRYSRQLQRGTSTNARLVLSTQALTRGIYYLHVTQGGHTERRQLVVE